MKILKKLDAILAGIMKVVTVGCCIGIAGILFTRVIIRFILPQINKLLANPIMLNLSWTDEVVSWMMAWMIFIAAALIAREKAHFSVDLLPTKLKGHAAGCILELIISLLQLIFFVVFLYYSVELTKSATTFSLSPIMKVTDRLPYSSMPVSCVIILIYTVRDIVVEVRELVTGSYKIRPAN